MAGMVKLYPSLGDSVNHTGFCRGVVHALGEFTGQMRRSDEDDHTSFMSGASNGIVCVTSDVAAGFQSLAAARRKRMWSLDADWVLSLLEVVALDCVLRTGFVDARLHTLDARKGEIRLERRGRLSNRRDGLSLPSFGRGGVRGL